MINEEAVRELYGDASAELFFERVKDDRIQLFTNEILSTVFRYHLIFKLSDWLPLEDAKEAADEVIDQMRNEFLEKLQEFDDKSFNAGRVVERFQTNVNKVLFVDSEQDV